MSDFSMFSDRWMMKRYGRYKTMNMVFGILPLCSAILMTQMKETSSPAHLWLTIVGGSFTFSHKSLAYYLTHQMPLGFGNAVVLQTMFSKNLSFTSYLTLIPSPSSRIGVASARIPDANRHWFRTIIARIRYYIFLHSSSLTHKSTP